MKYYKMYMENTPLEGIMQVRINGVLKGLWAGGKRSVWLDQLVTIFENGGGLSRAYTRRTFTIFKKRTKIYGFKKARNPYLKKWDILIFKISDLNSSSLKPFPSGSRGRPPSR